MFLAQMANVLRRSRARAGLPDWAARFQTQEEATLRKARAGLSAQIVALEQERANADETLQGQEWIKQLFCGTGGELVDAVERALTELGFRCAQVPGKRTDLLALDDHGLLAIEVKGVNKPAIAET